MLDRTTPPPIRQLSEFSITRPDRRTMKNGMPLNIIHAGTEDVVRFDLLIGGGQWNQEQPLQAMFANRMLREGAGNLTSSQIAERLDYYGAWLELSSSVNYGFITLYSLNKYFARTLAVISEMIKAPTFPAKELSVVADTNKQQFLVNSTRVEMIARKQLNTALFGPEHPFGRYAVAEDYDRITPEVLRSFYRKYYHSGNCSVYISGKVTSEIIRCIEDNLGSGQWGEVTEKAKTTLVPPVTTKEKRIFIEREDALQSSLKMGCFVMDRHHPDFLKARVMVTLFGGYFGSRLARGDSLRRRGVAQRRTVCGCRRACRKPALDSAGRFRTRHGTLLADGIPAGAGTGERRIRQPSDPRGGTAGAYGRASRARADRPPCAFRAERVLPDVFLSGYGGRTARHGAVARACGEPVVPDFRRHQCRRRSEERL